MNDMSEPGRQVAHVLLDLVSAFDAALGDDPTNTAAINLAAQRLDEVGAVTASLDPTTDQLDIDVSPVVGGAAVLLAWLVRQVELGAGITREQVVTAARSFVDRAGAAPADASGADPATGGIGP